MLDSKPLFYYFKNISLIKYLTSKQFQTIAVKKMHTKSKKNAIVAPTGEQKIRQLYFLLKKLARTKNVAMATEYLICYGSSHLVLCFSLRNLMSFLSSKTQ